MTKTLSYADSGVSIDAGDELVERIKPFAKKTLIPGVLGSIGGFGALFEISKDYKEPVLVTGTDGVGTKLKLAFLLNRHDTVGQDLVGMSVNDILVQGAKSLFFLDYFACGHLDVDVAERVVKGVAHGCELAGCALIGGETAEMPGMYPAGEYDLAGFAVGVVDRDKILDKNKMQPGDVVIALPSSGLHSNGYSLVRKVFDVENADLGQYYGELGCALGEELLRPTKIYVRPVLAAIEAADIRGISHITGGGFYENIPRMLPDGIRAVVKKGSYEVPAIFRLMQKKGNITDEMMYNTYNMGLGMVLALDPADVDKTLEALKAAGETAYVVGTCEAGEKGVTLC